jgi:hypothetical protein
LLALLVAALLGPGPATVAGQEATPATPATPLVARLEIDVWPEYDRPSVLVILRGELPEGSTLPTAISLRIPTSAGRPAALASAPSATAGLLSLGYEIADVQVDFTTVTFATPDRFFHLEFYDTLPIDNQDRSYRYVWPGDLAVGELVAQLQEPAGATGLSVEPELGAGVVGADGLSYREASLGAFEKDETLTIDVQYAKADPRSSAEILGLPGVDPGAPDGDSDSGRGLSSWLLVAAAGVAVAVAASVIVLWWRRWLASRAAPRGGTRAERRRRGYESDDLTCGHCGNPLRPGDRFCPSCGRPAGGG